MRIPINLSRLSLASISKLPRHLLIVFVLITLAACASTSDEEIDSDLGAQALYNKARNDLNKRNYQSAIEKYEALEARYPFGAYAEQAQLDIAYAYFKSNELDTAIASADRFIKLHPRHDNVDYAYYLRGLASSEKNDSFSDRFLPRNKDSLDPEAYRKAYEYFSELVKKFPNSRYVEDSIRRMNKMRNSLAKHELLIAEYYLAREAYVAAANRAKYIIENFPNTAASREALTILAQSYDGLKIDDLAADARRVESANKKPADSQPATK